jgi:4-diphosphocytidyl-2-C-methyl-D-erythritol kinase
MICFPNCKINLGLFITQKRADGYHDLETIFYPIPWKDVLEIIPSSTATKLFLSGKKIDGDATKNLVWKAFSLLKTAYQDKVSEVAIHLHKNLPMGAGLGGGSSDCAFMLHLLNDLFNLELSKEILAKHALQLGSDCPFFIYNSPQFAKGRGEMMQPVNIDLSDYSLQLICPEIHVSTSNAFSKIIPKPAPMNLLGLQCIPVTEWKHQVTNDFEESVYSAHPILKTIKEKLYECGAVYASMSGSGATIFGVFKKGEKGSIEIGTPFSEYLVY